MLYTGMAMGYADESAPINQWRAPRLNVDEFLVAEGFVLPGERGASDRDAP